MDGNSFWHPWFNQKCVVCWLIWEQQVCVIASAAVSSGQRRSEAVIFSGEGLMWAALLCVVCECTERSFYRNNSGGQRRSEAVSSSQKRSSSVVKDWCEPLCCVLCVNAPREASTETIAAVSGGQHIRALASQSHTLSAPLTAVCWHTHTQIWSHTLTHLYIHCVCGAMMIFSLVFWYKCLNICVIVSIIFLIRFYLILCSFSYISSHFMDILLFYFVIFISFCCFLIHRSFYFIFSYFSTLRQSKISLSFLYLVLFDLNINFILNNENVFFLWKQKI